MDWFTTEIYISKVGFEGEGSSWMRWLFEEYGMKAPLLVKLLALGILGACLLLVKKEYKRISQKLICLNVFVAGIIIWGIYCVSRVS
jgi:hypothetical protein